MKKFMAALMAVVLLGLAGCSGVQQGPSVSEEIRYDGQCALGMARGDCDIKGYSQWKVKYKGKIYYFQDEPSKDAFLSDIDRLIMSADKSWLKHVETHH